MLTMPAKTLRLSLSMHKQVIEEDISVAPTPDPRDTTIVPSTDLNRFWKSETR